MSLSKKLLIGFGVMMALVVTTSSTGLIVIRGYQDELDRAANVTARKQYLAGEANSAASEMASLERGSVLAAVVGDQAHSDAYEEQFREPQKRLLHALAELGRISGTPEIAALIRQLDEHASLAIGAHDELQRAMANKQLDAALAIFARKVQPQLEEIARGASSLVERQSRDLATASAASAAKSTRLRSIAFAMMPVVLVMGLAVFWVVRGANHSLRKLAGRMAENAGQVASAASQVSGASHFLAQGASQQAASLEETSASTGQITSITRRNADNAAEVAGLIEVSSHRAIEVNQTLDSMVEKMREIDASGNKIARIIKVIDEIAFQTNILALNAAVEAARAGAAGLGFAVVAGEVRSLAQRCAQAARDTAGLIEESIATSRDGSARLDRMSGAVRAMTESSSRVKTLVDEVSSGCREQVCDMERISSAVLQMQDLTQKTAASAQQSAAAGAELDGNAGALRSLVTEMREMVGRH